MVAARPTDERLFLSHNKGDREYVLHLASALQVAGASVWFDEWEIKLGESIPAAIDSGLRDVDTFVLVWSARAASSNWVRAEMDAALTKVISNEDVRFVPVMLDDSPLPPLVAGRKGLGPDEAEPAYRAAMRLLGLDGEREFRMAVQRTLDEAGLESREFWGAGTFVCCPECGAGLDALRGYQHTDDEHDRMYAGVQCSKCGWDAASEM